MARISHPFIWQRPKTGARDWISEVVIIALLTILLSGRASEPMASASTPRYVFKLTLSEFSILNAAEVDGLMKYGGGSSFMLTMSKEGNDVVWTVTIDNPRLMELVGIFVGEKAVKLVQGLDLDKIDPGEKIALQAIKTLSQKLEAAQKNPVWDKVKVSGTLVREGTDWFLQTLEGKLRLAGGKVAELKGRNGMALVAEGYKKVAGQLEVTRYVEKRVNTLEVFVMSLCPYGQRAEVALYTFLGKARGSALPAVEVHYLFYKVKKEGKEVFTSRHGEEEVIENLVQMVIRDYHPHAFQPYLMLRANSGNAAWKKLAEQAGLSGAEIAEVEEVVTNQREPLVQKEYDYATGRYEIYDGSPNYVWESERVGDLRKIEVFKGMDGAGEQVCTK